MKAFNLRLWLSVAWLLIAVVLYSIVPRLLSMTNFVFVMAVLLLLVVVAIAKGGKSATHESMADAIYKMDHPSTDRKS